MQKKITLGGFHLAAGQSLPPSDILDAATNREGLTWSVHSEGRSPVADDAPKTTQPGTRRPHLTIAVKGNTIQGFSL